MLELFRVLGVGTVPALLGLFRVPHIDFRLVSDPVGASVSNGSWTIRGRKAGCYRGELKLCPILLLFSSLVFRASPRTAFKCSMQAKARGLLPRIRVVALKAFLFMREYSTAWACSFPHRGTGRLPHRRDPSFHDLFRTLGKAEQGGGCNVRNSATYVLSFPSSSRAL